MRASTGCTLQAVLVSVHDCMNDSAGMHTPIEAGCTPGFVQEATVLPKVGLHSNKHRCSTSKPVQLSTIREQHKQSNSI